MAARNRSTRPAPDWVDEIAVERAIRGETVGRKLTRAERLAVAAHYRRRGRSTTALMRALRCNGSVANELLAALDHDHAAAGDKHGRDAMAA